MGCQTHLGQSLESWKECKAGDYITEKGREMFLGDRLISFMARYFSSGGRHASNAGKSTTEPPGEGSLFRCLCTGLPLA